MATAVKERPILFSGPMVRALLDGRKTQTRRIVKPWPPKIRLPQAVRGDIPFGANPVAPAGVYQPHSNPHGALCVDTPEGKMLGVKPGEFEWISPYGQPGDRLYVREAFCRLNDPASSILFGEPAQLVYRQELEAAGKSLPRDFKWKPSIHMPKWASRITLEITDVRVERLWDLSEEDALAEGVSAFYGAKTLSGCPLYSFDPGADPAKHYTHDSETCDTARVAFELGWDALNAKRGFGWDTNPWVWVVEFRRLA